MAGGDDRLHRPHRRAPQGPARPDEGPAEDPRRPARRTAAGRGPGRRGGRRPGPAAGTALPRGVPRHDQRRGQGPSVAQCRPVPRAQHRRRELRHHPGRGHVRGRPRARLGPRRLRAGPRPGAGGRGVRQRGRGRARRRGRPAAGRPGPPGRAARPRQRARPPLRLVHGRRGHPVRLRDGHRRHGRGRRRRTHDGPASPLRPRPRLSPRPGRPASRPRAPGSWQRRVRSRVPATAGGGRDGLRGPVRGPIAFRRDRNPHLDPRRPARDRRLPELDRRTAGPAARTDGRRPCRARRPVAAPDLGGPGTGHLWCAGPGRLDRAVRGRARRPAGRGGAAGGRRERAEPGPARGVRGAGPGGGAARGPGR
ncbi:hypothetical protein SGPA1_20343 [Streptomyces misionensis JCM 4497]